MKRVLITGRVPYEAPSVELIKIHIEEGILTGSMVRNNVSIEAMDIDDDELDW